MLLYTWTAISSANIHAKASMLRLLSVYNPSIQEIPLKSTNIMIPQIIVLHINKKGKEYKIFLGCII